MKGITKVVRWFWLMSGYVVLIKNKKGHDLGRTEHIKVDRFGFAFKPFQKVIVNPSQLLKLSLSWQRMEPAHVCTCRSCQAESSISDLGLASPTSEK